MKWLIIGSITLLSACPHPHETEYAKPDGPIPVVITNLTQVPMCYVSLEPSFTKMPPTRELVLARDPDQPPLQPGQSFHANIKAGSWQIHGETCGFTGQTDQQTTEFDIAGPLAVGIGGEDTTAPADYQRVTLKFQFNGASPEPDESSCLQKDAPLPYPPDATQCCSGNYYYNGTDNYHPFCN